MRLAAVEAEVGDDDLAFEARHQKEAEHERGEIAKRGPADLRQDHRVRIEREIGWVAQDAASRGRPDARRGAVSTLAPKLRTCMIAGAKVRVWCPRCW